MIVMAALMAACSKAPTSLGKPADRSPAHVENALSAAAGSEVVVQGVMTKKCPVAGCWFMLTEGSRTIKVDTKEAGFVVTDVPVDTKMIVSGRISTNGEERIIAATGLRY